MLIFSFQFDTVISKAIIITIYRELFVPVFFLPLSPSLSMCEFKTRRNALAQIISFYEKLCLCKFKMERKYLHMQRCKNNPHTVCDSMFSQRYCCHIVSLISTHLLYMHLPNYQTWIMLFSLMNNFYFNVCCTKNSTLEFFMKFPYCLYRYLINSTKNSNK